MIGSGTSGPSDAAKPSSSPPHSRWGLAILIFALLFLAIFLPFYCYQTDIHDPADISIDEVVRTAKPGDIIISIRVSRSVNKYRIVHNIVSVGTRGLYYDHVAIVVHFRNALHVFEISPCNIPRVRPLIYSENPRNTEKIKHSGFLPLREYLQTMSSKFALRRAKTAFDNAKLLDACRYLDHNATGIASMISNWIYYKAVPTVKLEKDDCKNLTCVEGIAIVLQRTEFQHSGFCRGMALLPFVEEKSAIFEGPVLRIQNNELLNW